MFPIKSSQFWGLIPYFKICVVDMVYPICSQFFPILVDYPSYPFISSSLLLISLDIYTMEGLENSFKITGKTMGY
jgi:hypothetical protein